MKNVMRKALLALLLASSALIAGCDANVGVGLNVNTDGEDLFPGSTSLRNETGKEIDRAALLDQLLGKFEEDIARL